MICAGLGHWRQIYGLRVLSRMWVQGIPVELRSGRGR